MQIFSFSYTNTGTLPNLAFGPPARDELVRGRVPAREAMAELATIVPDGQGAPP